MMHTARKMIAEREIARLEIFNRIPTNYTEL
jgi:hypothetical protein